MATTKRHTAEWLNRNPENLNAEGVKLASSCVPLTLR
jgi:hypothetical protein